MLADPLAIVQRIYDCSGLSLSEPHAAAIRAWLENHQPAKHGLHKHSPEAFGLDANDINHRFAAYRERFGLGFDVRPAATVRSP